MRVSVGDRDSEFYYVIDKDTDEKIDNCLWADNVSGEYEVLCLDAEGRVIFDPDEGVAKTEKKVGNTDWSILAMKRISLLNER